MARYQAPEHHLEVYGWMKIARTECIVVTIYDILGREDLRSELALFGESLLEENR